MTGKLSRSIAAFVLAGVTATAPVAPVFAANPAQAPTTAPAQSNVQVAPTSAPAGQTAVPTPNQTTAPTTPQNAAAGRTPPEPYTVPAGRDFTKPKPAFPHFLWPYTPIQVPEPQYANGEKIQQMIQAGKLPLTLEDAIELALENNPDIAVQRYNSWIAETDILRTKGGGAQRGVASAVSTNQAFADVPTLEFDPILSILGSLDSKAAPSNGSGITTSGTAPSSLSTLFTHTADVNFGYSQAFHTGTSMAVTFTNVRSSSSSSGILYNPLVESVGELSFNQPLLNGFGLLPNERYIRVARITKRAVDYAFQQSIITDLTAVENDYWELVFARGNVTVQQQAVDEAQQLYDNNKRQVEVGTLAPLEIVRAEAQLATAQQGLIVAQTAQLQQQIVLMSVITKDPNAPNLRDVQIVPTTLPENPPAMEDIPLTDALTEATQNRPDVLESKVNIEADVINVKAMKNGLLPTLNLSAFGAYTGLGGSARVINTLPGAGTEILGTGNIPLTVANAANGNVPTTIILPNTVSTITGVTPGGFGGDLSSFFHGDYPEFEAQLSLVLPIRNRIAQADAARAIISERQDQSRYQQTINLVTVDVHNAQIELQQDRAAYSASVKALDLQQQTLDADQKRLALGASTIFVVVTDQQNLAAAGAAEVRAQVNLEEARVNFERALGRVFSAHRITVANAQSGTVPHDNLIPGTTAGGDVVGLNEALAKLPNSAR